MAGYGKLAPYLWNDQKFRTLTPFQKLIFLYLLSNPYRNLIGLYFLDPRHASQDLDMPLQDFLSDIRSVCNTGMTDFDEEHNLVLIRNKLKHDPITNPNQKKAALALFKTIIVQSHNSLLCKTFLESNRYALNELYDPMLESWDLSPWGSPLPRPSESTSESPSLSGFESTGKVRKGKDRVSSSFSLEGGVGETKEKGPTPKDLMDLFNEICDNLPEVRGLSKGREDNVKKRIKEHPDIVWWRDVFLNANLSYIPPTAMSPNGWRPTFDFLMKNDTNALKTLEGAYTRREGIPHKQWAVQEMIDEIKQEEEETQNEQEGRAQIPYGNRKDG